MKARHFAPLLALSILSACSKSGPAAAPVSETYQATNDPGFNQTLQEYVELRDALRAKRCVETGCSVPRYPANKPLVEEILRATEKADAVVTYAAPAEVGSAERNRARNWRGEMLKIVAKIQASIVDTEAKLAALEPRLVPLRENLRALTERAAREGCTLPTEGKVINCAGVQPPLDSVDEARALLDEIRTADAFVGAYGAIAAAYAENPGVANEEQAVAEKKRADLQRYLQFIRPGFGGQVRELAKTRWTKTAESFRAAGVKMDLPDSLETEFKGDPSDDMIAKVETEISRADTIAGFGAERFAGKAIDRIEIVPQSSAVYGDEAFDYHPENEKSLTLKVNTDAGFFGLNWLLMSVPSRSDARYTQRAALIETWRKARSTLPVQEAGGTVIPISIHVDEDFLDELIKLLPLAGAIETMNGLNTARATLNAKLDAALRASGRPLRGNERFVLCDVGSCGRVVPGTFQMELGNRTPELTEPRLDALVNRLVKSL